MPKTPSRNKKFNALYHKGRPLANYLRVTSLFNSKPVPCQGPEVAEMENGKKATPRQLAYIEC